MHGEPVSSTRGEPLPPARTRWKSPATPPRHSGQPLGPVRSGLFAGSPPVTEPVVPEPDRVEAAVAEPDVLDAAMAVPDALDAAVAEPDVLDVALTEPTVSDTGLESPAAMPAGTTSPFWNDADAQPWLETPALAETGEPEPGESAMADAGAIETDDMDVFGTAGDELALIEDSELVLEFNVEAEEETTELTFESAAAQTEPMEEPPAPQTAEAAFDTPVTEAGLVDADEALRAWPGPLSPWDLGRGRARPVDPGRLLQEWESLGQALAESLGPAAASLGARSDLPTLDAEAAAGQGTDIEGLEPVGAGFEREERRPANPYDELAERLETLAARLRTDGRQGIRNAQLSGDPLEAMLAGFAAGWLAARGA